MPINNLEEIRKEVVRRQNNVDWSALNTQSNTQTVESFVVFLFAMLVCGVLIYCEKFIFDNYNGMVSFYLISCFGSIPIVGIVIFVFEKIKSPSIYQIYYLEHGNAFEWLLFNHFPLLKKERNVIQKIKLSTKNTFLLKHDKLKLDNRFFFLGDINDQKITFMEFNKKTLLISILENKNLTINNLYMGKQMKTDLTRNLKLLSKQKFEYFPELAQHFDFYTEQKTETAQFLQANEDIFVQMTKFTKYNLAIVFINNQVHCLLRGVDMDLLADVDYEVNLDDKEIADYFQQLEELSNFINLLQQIK